MQPTSAKKNVPAKNRVIIRYKDKPSRTDQQLYSQGLQGIEVVPLERHDNLENIVHQLSNHKDVSTVELDYQVRAVAEPNDARYSMQWGFKSANVPPAWNESIGDTSITVCVIDTGIDYNHADLAANIHPLKGWNAINQTSDPMDDNGHGTHCAGVIGAVGNNTNGVAGINWKVQLLGCKFLDSNGVGYVSGILACLDYCIQNNATISSNSYSIEGLDRQSSILKDAIAQAAQKKHLFIAAAGNAAQDNDSNERPSFPASFSTSNMMSVAALEISTKNITTGEKDLQLASYSNYGNTSVHIAAPGSQILSTWPGNWLAYLSGTSMAAPHVAGAAALIRAATNGSLDGRQIRSIIFETARKASFLEGKVSTQGVLDVDAAMIRAMELARKLLLKSPPPSIDLSLFQRQSPGQQQSSDSSKDNLFNDGTSDYSSFTVAMEIYGTSCIAFSRKAQGICSSLLRGYAGSSKIRDIRTTCKTPALFGKERFLAISSAVTMSQGQNGQQAIKNIIKNLEKPNGLSNDISRQLGGESIFKLRSFSISLS